MFFLFHTVHTCPSQWKDFEFVIFFWVYFIQTNELSVYLNCVKTEQRRNQCVVILYEYIEITMVRRQQQYRQQQQPKHTHIENYSLSYIIKYSYRLLNGQNVNVSVKENECGVGCLLYLPHPCSHIYLYYYIYISICIMYKVFIHICEYISIEYICGRMIPK